MDIKQAQTKPRKYGLKIKSTVNISEVYLCQTSLQDKFGMCNIHN